MYVHMYIHTAVNSLTCLSIYLSTCSFIVVRISALLVIAIVIGICRLLGSILIIKIDLSIRIIVIANIGIVIAIAIITSNIFVFLLLPLQQ